MKAKLHLGRRLCASKHDEKQPAALASKKLAKANYLMGLPPKKKVHRRTKAARLVNSLRISA